MLYSDSHYLNFTMVNSLVEFNHNFSFDYIYKYINLNTTDVQNKLFDFFGIMYFENAIIIGNNNSYYNNFVSSKGGVYTLRDCKYSDTGSRFANNSALYGGAIMGESIEITMRGCNSN